MKKTLLFTIIYLIAFSSASFAQCCSPGNPVSGSGNVGIVERNTLRTITFFRNSFSNTFYNKSSRASEIYQGTEARYSYVGEVLSYGIHKRLTLEAELGYFIEKTKKDKYFDMKGYGISTSVLGAKYCLLKTISHWEVTGGLGVKIPFSKKVFENDGGALPPDLQPSTGAFGIVGQIFLAKTLPDIGTKVIFVHRYEHNGRNDMKYRFGDAHFTSLFISKRLMKHVVGMLQFRNEYRTRDMDENITIINTGGDLLFVSPQLSFTFPPEWAVSVSADFPAYRNYNDMQLGPKYAFSITVTKSLKL